MVALAVRIRLVALRIRQLLGPGIGILRMIPINQRMIKTHAQTFRVQRLDDFLHKIAIEFRVSVVVTKL